MNKAWIAVPMVAAAALVGCTSEPEPVEQVPPPSYSAEPEPLPPVVISEGTPAGSPGRQSGGVGPAPIARTNEPEPISDPAPAARTYTVRKGDTLWAIAARQYGNGQKWVEIAQANPSIDPNKLLIGQQIVLP